MAYSAIADVQTAVGGEANLIALSDLDLVPTGTVDDTVVNAAIAEADAIIDSYASKRYAVPFNPVPTTIAKLSARLAARALRRNKPNNMPPTDVDDEKTDRAWLSDLAAGKVTPGVEPLPEKSALVVDTVGDRESVRQTTRERMKGWW